MQYTYTPPVYILEGSLKPLKGVAYDVWDNIIPFNQGSLHFYSSNKIYFPCQVEYISSVAEHSSLYVNAVAEESP